MITSPRDVSNSTLLKTMDNKRPDKVTEHSQVKRISVDDTTASVKTSKEEKKSHAFWKCLDQSDWVDDKKVMSCQYCMHDFTFTRRRHHCRKCGKIFCHDHINQRTIGGIRAKICTVCQEEYDQYAKDLQP